MQGCKLSLFDQFYLVLQKSRVGTLNQVLADTFKKKNMPTCFKSMYTDYKGIIDASEIKVQATIKFSLK